MEKQMGQLDNKVALVTGGSTGIGLAIARRFAAEGATVYLTGRRKAELDGAPTKSPPPLSSSRRTRAPTPPEPKLFVDGGFTQV